MEIRVPDVAPFLQDLIKARHQVWLGNFFQGIENSYRRIEENLEVITVCKSGITFFWRNHSCISERPMNRHRHRPNLEVRLGSAEPPNLQVRSAEPRPNQFTK